MSSTSRTKPAPLKLKPLESAAFPADLRVVVLPSEASTRLVHALEMLGARTEVLLPSGDRLPPAQGRAILHPATHPWRDRGDFGRWAERAGYAAVAPSSKAVTLFSNKLALFNDAAALGIPNLAMHSDPMRSLRELRNWLKRAGGSRVRFPLVLKSIAGRGPQTVLVLHSDAEIERRLPWWLEQLKILHGEALFFLENYKDGSRRIQVPFARLADGTFKTFAPLDLSLQSRSRQLVAICGTVAPVDATELGDWTRRIADGCGYVGLGALDYLVDGDRAYLIEGTPGLTEDFTGWERVSGESAIAWQFAALGLTAAPRASSPKDAVWVGARIYAENSWLQLPRPGVILERDAGKSDAEITPEITEDATGAGLVARVEAVGKDLASAVKLAAERVEALWIAGALETNQRYVAELLKHPWVSEGMFHTGFLDEEFLAPVDPPRSAVEAMAAAVVQLLKRDDVAVPPLLKVGRLKVPTDSLPVLKASDRVCVARLNESSSQGRWQVTVRVGGSVASALVSAIAPMSHPPQSPEARDGSSVGLLALTSGKVHARLFKTGVKIPAHEPICVIESGGTLIPHAVPIPVELVAWNVDLGQSVTVGEALARVRSSG